MEHNDHSPLYSLWERTLNNLKGIHTPPSPDQWNEQVFHLSQNGRGMEEALTYMLTQQPSYEAFCGWVQDANNHNTRYEESSEKVLSQADHDFWEENGYLIIKNAVPPEQCEAARTAIWEFLNAGPTEPASWYETHNGKNGLMLSFFQHPALNANRYATRIRNAYRELYGSSDIYLLVDKVSFNPPENGSFTFKGSPLHWDVSLQLPIPFVLQGLLYLNDVGPDEGAFHCVPGFHNRIGDWVNSLPEGTNPRDAAIKDLKPIPVPGNAGDLVIWHQALPHCATPNTGTSPRMVQYIAYKPLKHEERSIWK